MIIKIEEETIMDILKNIENAVILSIFTSGCFLVGWIYIGKYYEYFGISSLELTLDFNYYLIKSFPSVAVLFLIIMIYCQINNKAAKHKYLNIYAFSCILLFITIILATDTIMLKIIYGSLSFCFFIAGGFLIKKSKDKNESLLLWYKVMFFSIVYVFLIVFSSSLAYNKAKHTLLRIKARFLSHSRIIRKYPIH